MGKTWHFAADLQDTDSRKVLPPADCNQQLHGHVDDLQSHQIGQRHAQSVCVEAKAETSEHSSLRNTWKGNAKRAADRNGKLSNINSYDRCPYSLKPVTGSLTDKEEEGW